MFSHSIDAQTIGHARADARFISLRGPSSAVRLFRGRINATDFSLINHRSKRATDISVRVFVWGCLHFKERLFCIFSIWNFFFFIPLGLRGDAPQWRRKIIIFTYFYIYENQMEFHREPFLDRYANDVIRMKYFTFG